MNIDELVSKLVRARGSDLHLKVGLPPMIRANGVLKPLEGYEVLRPVDTEDIIGKIMSEKHLKEFELEGDPDFSYTV